MVYVCWKFKQTETNHLMTEQQNWGITDMLKSEKPSPAHGETGGAGGGVEEGHIMNGGYVCYFSM